VRGVGGNQSRIRSIKQRSSKGKIGKSSRRESWLKNGIAKEGNAAGEITRIYGKKRKIRGRTQFYLVLGVKGCKKGKARGEEVSSRRSPRNKYAILKKGMFRKKKKWIERAMTLQSYALTGKKSE